MARTKQLKKLSKSLLSSQEKKLAPHPAQSLQEKECKKLSASLFHKGELCLLRGDRGGIEYFDRSAELDPQNAHLFLHQGLALLEYGTREEREEGLTLASKRLKIATILDPDSFQGWYLWGNVLYLLGKKKREPSYFFNALKKYKKALELTKDQPPDTLADLYWNLGDLWGVLADSSGEIAEYHYCIKSYEKATTFQDDLDPKFWMSFGNSYLTVGKKTNDTRFIAKAINCYKSAISMKISLPTGWFLLGKAIKTLYGYTHDEDHFSQANECFQATLQLSKNEGAAYLEWARLLLESGTLSEDPQKIRASIEKCSKGYQCNSNSLELIAVWVESLALLGSYTERLEPIYEAMGKIEPLLESCPTPETFYAYGMCFHALGTYYDDLDYYYQALEQFQEGLALNRTHHRLWYAMASSSFAASLIDPDEKNYEGSLHFFKQALNLQKSSLYHSQYGICLLKYGEASGEKEIIERSTYHFEQALNLQKNAAYVHTDWIFYYACALDQLAGFLENDSYYLKAIDLLRYTLMLKPEFPQIHFQLALTYGHYGELINDVDIFHRALHHYRIAHQKEKENDQIVLDWAITLANFGNLLENSVEGDHYLREAEHKMIQAAKLGNAHAYYALASLYSLKGNREGALHLLEKARVFDVLPTIEEILEDDWLENLRETEEFRIFIDSLGSRTN